MRSLRFEVRYADGRKHQVEVWPIDLEQFEDEFSTNALQLGPDTLTFKQLSWLAHAAYMHDPDSEFNPKKDRKGWLSEVLDIEVAKPAGDGPLDESTSTT